MAYRVVSTASKKIVLRCDYISPGSHPVPAQFDDRAAAESAGLDYVTRMNERARTGEGPRGFTYTFEVEEIVD